MSPELLAFTAASATPHVVAVLLVSARLLPVAMFCPLLGGNQVPSFLRLGLVLTASLSIHALGDVGLAHTPESFAELAGPLVRELVLGIAMGLIASLPFDAAKMGGRVIDLLRGTSAEALNPVSGTRESAAGEGLHQLLLALASAGIALPMLLSALFRSFAVVKLGTYVASPSGALAIATLAGTALGTGLAVGAPIAAVTLATDCWMGLLARAVPQLRVSDSGAPLKILGGGAVLWLGVGAMSDRLLQFAAHAMGDLTRIAGL